MLSTGSYGDIPLRRTNTTITVILGCMAMLAWGFTGYGAWVRYSVPAMYPVISVAITLCACLGWILITIADIRRDTYTRCRQCDHILRGLSEPRCPECGTPI